MKQRTYKATGINLKGMPMGESDRLVTVLTKEHGLVRAIAPGARKHKSRLGGRSGMFVVNDVLFTKGKSIDKLIQAETLQSFPGLSQDLAKLTASQYLAEIVLAQALTEQPQEALYYLLIEHLSRIEAAAKPNVLACLAQATFHLLALAGVAPEVFRCALSRVPLTIELGNPDWQVGFSVSSGGAIAVAEIERITCDRLQEVEQRVAEREQERQLSATGPLANSQIDSQADSQINAQTHPVTADTPAAYSTSAKSSLSAGLKSQIEKDVAKQIGIVTYLSAAELALMQQLSKPELVLTTTPKLSAKLPTQFPPGQFPSGVRDQFSPESGTIRQSASTRPGFGSNQLTQSGPHLMWRHIEQALRQYTQYQFDRPIKSAALIDTCFS
ncbi:MAG: DNA repair protein RecO [Phormidesmis sp.]